MATKKKDTIFLKGEDKTSEVRFYKYNPNTKKWDVTFNNGGVYSYSYHNVKIIKNQDSLGVKVTDNTDVYKYLNEISALFDFVKNDKGENVLEKRIADINVSGSKTALSRYLNPLGGNLENRNKEDYYVFPFGCNNSQYHAIVKALNNKISVIQGPPGTGKTQTILNLIANIVMQGKTVLVVSNNNSAIENVFEKISDPKLELGFIVASLGKADNKKQFIIEQSGKYPDFNSWNLKVDPQDRIRAKNVISSNLKELINIFEIEEKLSTLKNDRNQISIEYKYFKNQFKDSFSVLNQYTVNTINKSGKWLGLWNEFELRLNAGRGLSFFQKFKLFLLLGTKSFSLLKFHDELIIRIIQNNYYNSVIKELENKIDELSKLIKNKNLLMNSLQSDSLQLVRYYLSDKYSNKTERRIFEESDLWRKSNEVLAEYPVILSTTFSSTTSLNKNVMYDYIIMDEASQIDVVTGALALSCARNAIIVGDMMQLPNVVKEEDKKKADAIFAKYNIATGYKYTNSFLQSVLEVFPSIECTLLKEHYRCHPKIINFCNQMFYNNELVVMTEDNGEMDTLSVYKTAKGDHVRGHYSQRQIDEIINIVSDKKTISSENTGIITPYRDQVKELKSELGSFEVATVHKFQGREKDNIIISTVDDEISDFVNNPNLLNVAVSRAKKRLIVVVSGNEQKDNNITALVDYIEYNKFEIVDSKIYSIFDYLYKQYDQAREEYFKTHKRVSVYDSENLMYHTIKDILADDKYKSYDVVLHYPLNMIVKDYDGFTEREKIYAQNQLTHVDFLIYKKMNKQPVCAIEVDGTSYHNNNNKQGERDKLKNHIFELIGMPLYRFKTNESEEKERIINILDSLGS